MSAPYLLAIRHAGSFAIAKYCQNDGCLMGQGLHLFRFLRTPDNIVRLKEGLSHIEQISDSEGAKLHLKIDECDPSIWGDATVRDSWSSFLDHPTSLNLPLDIPGLPLSVYPGTGAEVLELISSADAEQKIPFLNDIGFANYGPICEWAYIIDLDREVLEVYSGCQIKEPDHAFFDVGDPVDWVPHLNCSYMLSALEDLREDRFLEHHEKSIEEGEPLMLEGPLTNPTSTKSPDVMAGDLVGESSTMEGPLNKFLVDSSQTFIDDLRRLSNMEEYVTLPFSIFPLEDFEIYGKTLLYLPQDGTRLSVTPLHLAAASGKADVLTLLLGASNVNCQPQGYGITALSLALYCGHLRLARVLLDHGAQPDCSPLVSSLHAAARRGFKDEIVQFVQEFELDPDIEDKDGATPIVYALQLPEEDSWDTICLLFYLGASTSMDLEVGDSMWTYADLARAMGKEWLATKLEEVADDSSTHTLDYE
ncbi:hypothetical protein ACJ41O_006474 [Fusarium nematophilum]